MGANQDPSVNVGGLLPLDSEVEACWNELAHQVEEKDLENMLILSGLAGTVPTLVIGRPKRNPDGATHYHAPKPQTPREIEGRNAAWVAPKKPAAEITVFEAMLNRRNSGIEPSTYNYGPHV